MTLHFKHYWHGIYKLSCPCIFTNMDRDNVFMFRMYVDDIIILAFLQILHRYQITVRLPLKDASEGYEVGETHGVYCHAENLQVLYFTSLYSKTQ